MAKVDHTGQTAEEKVKCTTCKPEDYGAVPLRELAKRLIRGYVIRGDSLDSISKGQTGVASNGYHTAVGCHISINGNRKKLTNQQIGVSRFDGGITPEVFSLPEIYKEIQNEQEIKA